MFTSWGDVLVECKKIQVRRQKMAWLMVFRHWLSESPHHVYHSRGKMSPDKFVELCWLFLQRSTCNKSNVHSESLQGLSAELPKCIPAARCRFLLPAHGRLRPVFPTLGLMVFVAAWNQLWWEYLYHRSWQTLMELFFFFWKADP